METTIVGIDPGKDGGIAIFSGGDVEAVKMPETERDLFDLIEGQTHNRRVVVFLEKVSSSPQMGVVSAFKFGRTLGLIHMACVASGARLEWVTPQKWQKEFGLIVKGRGLGQSDTEKKNRNKARAQELFPRLKITHAIADAILIAEYGRRVTH